MTTNNFISTNVALVALFIFLVLPLHVYTQPVYEDHARRQEIISRYLEMLEDEPYPGYNFDALTELLGAGRDYETLLNTLEQSIVDNPDNFEHFMILGMLYQWSHKYDEALSNFSNARQLKPKNYRVVATIGNLYFNQKQFETARSTYEEALTLAKSRENKQEILRTLASIAFSEHDKERALDYLKELAKSAPRDRYLQTEIAETLLNNELFTEALEQYERLLSLAGKDKRDRAMVMRDKGYVLELMGNTAEAITLYRTTQKALDKNHWLRSELNHRIVDIYRRENNLGELIDYLEDQGQNKTFEQLLLLAELRDETGDEEMALNLLTKAQKKNKRNTEVRVRRIQLLSRQGKISEVIDAYRELIAIAPKDDQYRFELAELLYQQGKKEEALKQLDRISKSFARDMYVHERLANLYERWGNSEKALKERKLLIKLDPSDEVPIIALGEHYFMDGQRKKAFEIWSRLLNIIPDRASAHARLGDIYSDHGLLSEAIEMYSEAVRLNPDSFEYKQNLALLHERAGNLEQATELWETLLSSSTDAFQKYDVRSHIIKIYERQGILTEKLIRYREDFEKDPPAIEAGYFLGEAYLHLGKLSETEQIYTRILDLNPHDTDALLALEELYTSQSKYAKSIEVLKRLVELNPGSIREYYQRIADYSMNIYKDEEALKYARLAVDLNPDYAESHARLAKIYKQMQMLEQAASEYRRTIEIDRHAWKHYFSLGEILVALNRVEEADKLYIEMFTSSYDEMVIQESARKSILINELQGTLKSLEGDITKLQVRVPPKAAYQQITIELYDHMTTPLITQVNFGSPEERTRATFQLTQLGQRALNPLLKALGSPNVSMQSTAIRILGYLNNSSAALALARLLDGNSHQTRLQAALALGKLRDPQALNALIRATTPDNDRTIREVALWAIGRTGSGEALKILDQLSLDQSWHIRALTGIALGRIGAKEGLTTLKRLAEDRKKEVRMASAWGLGMLGDVEGLNTLIELQSEKGIVSAMATWSLATIPDPKALEALLRAYWGPQMRLREKAADSLLRWRSEWPELPTEPHHFWEEGYSFMNFEDDRFSVQYLLDSLMRRRPEIGTVSTHKTLMAGSGAIINTLDEVLERDNEQLILMVLSDLDQRDNGLSFGILTPVPGYQELQNTLQTALINPLSAKLPDKLTRLLNHSNPYIRLHAVSLLGKLRYRVGTEEIIRLLDDENPWVQGTAAIALGQIGGDPVFSELQRRIPKANGTFRAYCATALGHLGTSEAKETLKRLAVNDDTQLVRLNSISALGHIGGPEEGALLMSRLDREDRAIQIEILQALGAIKYEPARSTLEEYTRSGNPKLRLAAERGLSELTQ